MRKPAPCGSARNRAAQEAEVVFGHHLPQRRHTWQLKRRAVPGGRFCRERARGLFWNPPSPAMEILVPCQVFPCGTLHIERLVSASVRRLKRHGESVGDHGQNVTCVHFHREIDHVRGILHPDPAIAANSCDFGGCLFGGRDRKEKQRSQKFQKLTLNMSAKANLQERARSQQQMHLFSGPIKSCTIELATR